MIDTAAPLDVADLDLLFTTDRPAALAQLAQLSFTQLVMQAFAYAAYCESTYGRVLDAACVAVCWSDAIARAEGV